MRTAVHWLFLLALIVWLGETIFLSFVVAPTLFGRFPVEEAGRVMSALFPAYYAVGAACGVVLVGAALVLRRWSASASSHWVLAAAIGAVMLVAVLYASLSIQPRVHALREERRRPGATARAQVDFDRLHRLSVQLNGLVLAGGIALSLLRARAAARVEA